MVQKTFLGKTMELEMPNGVYSQNDIETIKNTFKIPPEYTLEQTQNALNQMKESQSAIGQTSILKDIPSEFPPGSPEYNNLMAEKIANLNQRVQFSNDPLKYAVDKGVIGKIKVPGTNWTPIPEGIVSKPTFEMVGGLLGLLAVGGKDFLTRGTMFNPALYATGEYGGTMAGGQVYDKVNDFMRWANDLEPKSLEENIDQFTHDAYMNLAFTGGSMVIGPIFNAFKNKIAQATFGLKPKSETYKKTKQLYDTYGIPYSTIQATNYGLWKNYPKVIGVFPWVGKPFKTQGQAIDESLRQYLDNMANGLAPTQTIFNLAGDITNIFKNNYKSVRAAQGMLFDDFYKYADKLRGKKIIDITAFKGRAGDVAERFMGNAPEGAGGILRFPGDAAQKSFGNFYRDLSNLPDQITMEQAISLKQIFNDFTTNFEGAFKGRVPDREAAALNKLNLVLENDFMHLKNVDNAIDKALFDAAQLKYATAVDFFSNTMSRFEGGVPGQIKMAKPSIFGPGADVNGMLYGDEAFKTILSRAKNSKEAMEHLIDLSQPSEWELKAWTKAGKQDGVLENVEVYLKDMDPNSKTFEQYVKKTIPVVSAGPMSSRKRIMRKLIDDAFYQSIQNLPAGKNYTDFLSANKVPIETVQEMGLEKAAPEMLKYKDVIFGVKQFEQALGLDNPEGIEILNTLLKGTGTKVEDIRKFLSIAEDAGSFVVPDASTFLQRRLTLTGVRGLLLMGAKGAAGAGITLTNVMIPLMMRYGSELLTDPKALKAFTEVLDTNTVTASNMTTIMNWAAGTDMPKDSDEAAMMDKIQQVDKAVFSLMKTPQTELEFMPAREEQYNMEKTKMLDEQQAFLQNYLNQYYDMPSIPVNLPEFQPNAGQLTPEAREALAFRGLDEAIAAQTGGIGAMVP